MARFIRGLICATLSVSLLVLIGGLLFTVLVEAPESSIFWQIMLSAFGVALTSIFAALSSLTLSTRYVLVGGLGIGVAFLSLVTFLYETWTEAPPATSMTALAPTNIVSGYVDPNASEMTMGLTLIVLLLAVALPIINFVLYFAYESNIVGEIVGAATALAIVASIVLPGVAIANGSMSEDIMKYVIALVIFSVGGVIGTPALSAIDAGGILSQQGSSRNRRHYDIEPNELPSALPSSQQYKYDS